MADLQALLSALDVFSRAPDHDALEKANSWLQDFQHSSEAWNTCSLLLSSPDAPPAAKMFAAQTFRQKITYDLQQVAPNQVFALRDTLIAALEAYKDGPRGIIVQLCLALSGLAIQLPTWGNAVQTMVEAFGGNPATVPVLLEFLIVLPEELCSNTKIPITDDEYRERIPQLLTNNVSQILELLSVYLQAQGVTIAVQNQVFRCLRSWLVAGEVAAASVAETPLFDFSFEALASEQLFDAAIDVVCDLIHETQEVDDNMAVIERIMPHVIALRPRLSADKDDPDKIRGYARIFAEAGECYRSLILHHTEAFFPLVEAILECSTYHNLDIVPITFPFWERLAQSIGKRTSLSPLFSEAYKQLMKVIIGHLHFPQDTAEVLGQERDSFRQFRHVMGDTLKDCCLVLGTETCLIMALEMVTSAMSRLSNATWQDVEAPLFAMRSMGAEVDLNDETSVPKIMSLVPRLPDHPRVRYAALLLLSRYTRWINQHPDYVPAALQYISSGFEDADDEVCAAAGHAMRYLCEDCKQYLVPFVEQLHTFINTVGPRLVQDDRVVVYEAIAHVISAMPMENAAQMLRTFALDLLQSVLQLATKTTATTKQDIKMACDNLASLEVMLYTVGAFGETLPVACRGTCEQAWEVLDAFFLKYGTDPDCAEAATRVIRQGLSLFGAGALSVIPSVVNRMTAAFENTAISSYLWVTGKIVQIYGNEEDSILRASFRTAYERTTNKVILLLGAKQPGFIPDVLDDYVRMLIQLVDHAPDITFESSAFPYAFRAAMAALTLVQSDIVFAALDFFRIIVNHDCLHPAVGSVPPPKFPIYASAINHVIEKEGLAFVGLILAGIVGDFPEDAGGMVMSIVQNLAILWPQQLLQWITPALQALPSTSVPDEAKSRFLDEATSAVSAGQAEKVKYAVLGIHRTSRKARERRRVGPMT